LIRQAVLDDIADVIQDDERIFAWCRPHPATDLLQIKRQTLGRSQQNDSADVRDIEPLRDQIAAGQQLDLAGSETGD
jgi:hypothetical protein